MSDTSRVLCACMIRWVGVQVSVWVGMCEGVVGAEGVSTCIRGGGMLMLGPVRDE